MERFDVLDADGRKKGYERPRSHTLRDGEFALVAEVMLKNSENKLLLTYRDPRKNNGGCWEIPGGVVKAGEESLDAVRRELSEETGITLPKEAFSFVRRVTGGRFIFDLYQVQCDFPIERVIVQEGETTDAIYAEKDEFISLCKRNRVTKSLSTTLYKNILEFLEEHSL